jgi:AraC-like DNA-binding protein
MPILYLTGPMLYFYVRSTLNDSSHLSKWDGIHFIPAIVGFISIFPYYFESFDSKLKIANNLINNPNYHLGLNISWLYDNSYNLLFRMVLLTFYVLISFIILIRFHWKKKTELTFNQNQKGIVLKWLYAVLLLVGICTISYLVLTVDFFNGELNSRSNINTLNINYFFGVSFSLIPVMMIVFPQVLYGIPSVKTNKFSQINFSSIDKDQKNSRFASKLNEEEDKETFEKLAEMILEYLRKEKPFKDPDFCLSDLSNSLKIPKHHLHYCFNTILNSRFTTIRAQLRVEFAKDCLLRGDLNQLSMEGIWTNAGFSSKTSFFVLFKEITGVTPTEFIKVNQLEAIDKDVN